MVDVNKVIVAELNKILPTYHESFLDSKSEIPCISYFTYSNIDDKKCSIYGYSTITITVKVWDNSIANLQSNSQLVDKTMRKLGFSRVSLLEQKQNTLLCNVINYRCLADEKY